MDKSCGFLEENLDKPLYVFYEVAINQDKPKRG